MSSICYTVIVTLIHTAVFVSYLIVMLRKKENEKLDTIDNVFYFLIMIISIVSLIVCVVLMINQNAREYFATYIVLFLSYIFFTNLYSSIEDIDVYTKKIISKFGVLLGVEIGLFVLTILLENIIPIKRIVINRVVVVFIVCSLYYTLKLFLLLNKSFDKKLISLIFDVSLTIYLCLYSILYLVQNERDDVIGEILVSLSILTIFFDKADKIVLYFNYKNKSNKQIIDEKGKETENNGKGTQNGGNGLLNNNKWEVKDGKTYSKATGKPRTI